ncbi:hypothetical protein [Streptomyces sp. NPDC059783]|uniref:hypothetical protein n=1 Tax=Streptomyces sp. NPDC059783 TaxID=3346944 RepID=UPI0036654AAC
MTTGRGPRIALHLFLVWATMTPILSMLGFALVLAAWDGGAADTVPVLALGVPLAIGLLTLTGLPVADLCPMCGSASQRWGWAVLVFVLGTPGLLAGLAAYDQHVSLGSAGTRVALTGVPYVVAAALFVPSRPVRLGALASLVAAVVYAATAVPAIGS